MNKLMIALVKLEDEMALFVVVLLASFALFSLIESKFDINFVGLSIDEAKNKDRIQRTLSISFAIMETVTSSVCSIAFIIMILANRGFVEYVVCLAPIIETITLRVVQLSYAKSKKWVLIRLTLYIVITTFAALLVAQWLYIIFAQT